MTIKNVTLNDDSTFGKLGRYECHAFAVGDPKEYKHGFSVNVILSKCNSTFYLVLGTSIILCIINFISSFYMTIVHSSLLVKPPESNSPKCQDLVVAYGRWSLGESN